MAPVFWDGEGRRGESEGLLLPRRNWCEVTEDAVSHDVVYALRCEMELGKGNMQVFEIPVPALLRS